MTSRGSFSNYSLVLEEIDCRYSFWIAGGTFDERSGRFQHTPDGFFQNVDHQHLGTFYRFSHQHRHLVIR